MKKLTIRLLFSILTWELISLPIPIALAQTALDPKPSDLQVELKAIAGTRSQTPFWLRANQFGAVPLQAPSLLGGFRYTLDYRKKYIVENDSIKLRDKPFAWGVGIHPVFNLGNIS